MKKVLWLLFFIIQWTSAQVNIGLKHDRFISTHAVVNNPSASLQNPHPWEVNLLSADVFLQNNYAFISEQSLMGMAQKETLYQNTAADQNSLPKNTLGYNNKGPFNLFLQTDVLGPAAALKFKIKDQHYAAGFYTRLRTLTSALGIDGQYAYLNFVNQPSFTRYLSALETTAVSLQENAIFVSRSFQNDDAKEWNAGITLKQSNIWDAIIFRSNGTFQLDYDRPADELTFSDYNFDIFSTTSYDTEEKKYIPQSNGTSYGADLGITYVDYGEYDKEDGDYLHKIGLSVTDLGFVNIKGEYHNFMNDPFTLNKNYKFSNDKTVSGFYRELSNIVYNNPNSSLVDTSLRVALPTAIHFSYSGNVWDNRYLTLGLTQRVPLANNAFRTPNLLYANFAYGKPAFSYAAQVSLFEYQRLQIGGYLRLGPFFVGSDNVLPFFFNQKKLNSFDFYLGLKIYPFWSDAMSRRYRKDCNCD